MHAAKSIPVHGGVHNTYVTPDGKHVVARLDRRRDLTVIDTKTEEPVWSHEFDLGVRPMAFETNPDGSTKRVFVQLTEFNGFAVVDFATRKESHAHQASRSCRRARSPCRAAATPSHGMAVTADNKTLIVDSRLNSAVYIYSLPDLKLLGGRRRGIAPNWVTLTPDGKSAYVAIAGSNASPAIDIRR